ncbi:Deoxyribonuclease-2-alpha [Labeo rohita]|uniref:Deoxyribonuclease-2-alpha n=1 Tax=Labeo rohita TaxID=84645 RepID=A0ABQ8LWF3_LABRO|nr:Deoxyribonuclease-2-alpha [Labeo rohita]
MLLHVLLLLHASKQASSTISCYDDQGKPEGLKYLFMDGETEGWIEGKTLVNDSQSAVGRTVGPLYEGGEVGYISYNDQPPQQKLSGNASRSCGHTKGVVVFDKQQGFWLVHSTPHFPPPKSEGQFSYPSSGINNGQNFICVTYPFERFQTIGEQLKINQPHIYDCSIPASLAAAVPAMAQLCKHTLGRWDNTSSPPPSNRSISLLSLAGTEFISFAKGASFANVLNIDLISPSQGITFKSTEDHSKWAVSPDSSSAGSGTSGGWVCVGDINRDEAEEKRGGGTVCHQDAVVWKAYRSAALQCETCDGGVQTCEKAAWYHR